MAASGMETVTVLNCSGESGGAVTANSTDFGDNGGDAGVGGDGELTEWQSPARGAGHGGCLDREPDDEEEEDEDKGSTSFIV